MNGIYYQLELEFGNVPDVGRTTYNEFYALEGQEAKAELLGRLVEVGNVGFQH